MSTYIRQDINGTTPLDMKNLNDALRYIFLKVCGDINMADIQDDIKNMLYTNWLPIQGEGNIDATHPLYIRFYIPPNTRRIKSGTLNIITSRYRVDSDVTKAQEIPTHSSTVTSLPNTVTTVAQSSNETSGYNNAYTATVDYWGDPINYPYYCNPAPNICPIVEIPDGSSVFTNHKYIWKLDGNGWIDWAVMQTAEKDFSDGYAYVDMASLNHQHKIPAHSHKFVHQHEFPHTHPVEITVDVGSHGHDLNMGIKEASTPPQGVAVSVNDHDLGIVLNGDNQVSNDIKILDKLAIGSWNTIKISSSSISRVTIYGIAELLQDY